MFRLYPLHIVTTASVLLAVVAVQTAKLVLSQFGLVLGNEAPFAIEFFNLKLLGLDLVLLQGVGIMRMEIHNYPSWSISVEFWLYLVFALLMLAVRPRAARIAMSVAIVALCVAYFVGYWSSAPEALRTLDTRGLPRGLLSFFQGVLLFYLWLHGKGRFGGALKRPRPDDAGIGRPQAHDALSAACRTESWPSCSRRRLPCTWSRSSRYSEPPSW